MALQVFHFDSTNDTSGPTTIYTRSKSDTVGTISAVNVDDGLGVILFRGAGTSSYVNGALIKAEVDAGTVSNTSMPGRLVFSTTADGASSPTERMRIDNAGNVGIGRAPTQVLDVYRASGSIRSYVESASLADGESSAFTAVGGNKFAGLGVLKHSGITNPCGYIVMEAENDTDYNFWVDNSGDFRISTVQAHVGTTSGTVVGTQTSDQRIKNILGPVEYGLETLKQLDPVRYSLKSDPVTEKLGFVAQQVQPLVPQSVFDTGEHIEGEPEDAPTKLGMEYVALIPVLVNAIKELSAEVDALKVQLQAQ